MNDKYNDAEAQRIARLVAGYVRGTLTKKEHDELDDWVAANDENMELFERLTDEKNLEQVSKWMETLETEKALKEKKAQINFTKPSGRKMWLRFLPYAAAASVIIIAGLLLFKPFDKKNTKSGTISNLPDILPGSEKATLTFEDGRIIKLDDIVNDTSINDQIKVLQKQGEVVYTNQTNNNPMAYHTLNVPRKGQYKLVLPDGTKVWINAESSIRYPVSFDGNERKVFVTGETYFEVAKDKTKPFRVIIKDITVEALGTAFNINAYANEPFFSTTLIEGSVLVSNGKTENVIKPGQQAKISGTNFTIADVEYDAVVAWKNNQFKFINATLDVIMRQIERWYDAEVVYENMPSDHFNADIPRDVPVSKLLYFLEKTNRVHFKIEDKKIIVRN
jgi:transmembrane sensor